MHNKLFRFRNGLTILIYIVFNNVKLAITKDNSCYMALFSNTSWTDQRPYFTVNMTFNPGSIQSLTWVEKDIAAPIAKLRIVQNESNRISTLYNITTRLCDIQQFIKKVPMFKDVLQSVLKQGNYSMDCPMRKGFYIMDNMRVGNRNPAMSFMYRPKTSYTFIGGMYEEAKNKSLIPLTTYKFTAKIVKKSCKET